MCSVRVSTEDHACEGFSLPEQKERLETFCKFKGYAIVDYYTNAGISAKTGNLRPEFERLNKDINVKDMNGYIEMQEEISKNQERLEKANKKFIELIYNSTKIKEIVDNLKITITSKNKYALKQDDKNKINTNILNKIKNKVLKIFIELEKKYGNLDDYYIDFSNKKEKKEVIKNITNIITDNSVHIGDSNKIESSNVGINNKIEKDESNGKNILIDIFVGIFVAVVGGIILYFIT